MSEVEPIPFLDITDEFTELQDAWMARIREVGHTGRFILGPHVEAFERSFAEAVGVSHAVGVASGTDALVLALRAFDIGPGDEVITSAYSFFASAEAVTLTGATPVFADIDPDTFNMDPASVEAKITPRTRALMPVHLYGAPAPMTELTSIARARGLSVIEDCAQAFGAQCQEGTVGSLGDAGCFSFYPTKVLGAYGDGGMITVDGEAVAQHLRRLRNHGASAPFEHAEVGYNSRLDEIQAALLRLKLERVEDAIAKRRAIAERYDRGLSDCAELVTPSRPAAGRHVYNLYTVRSIRRDALREHLKAQAIASTIYYPIPLHLQPVYRRLGYGPGDFPGAERAANEVLSLPIYPGMPDAHVDRVCEAVRRFHER